MVRLLLGWFAIWIAIAQSRVLQAARVVLLSCLVIRHWQLFGLLKVKFAKHMALLPPMARVYRIGVGVVLSGASLIAQMVLVVVLLAWISMGTVAFVCVVVMGSG